MTFYVTLTWNRYAFAPTIHVSLSTFVSQEVMQSLRAAGKRSRVSDAKAPYTTRPWTESSQAARRSKKLADDLYAGKDDRQYKRPVVPWLTE